jgi:CRISPR system Cascade subunit CasE
MHRTLSRAFPQDTFRKTRDDSNAAGVLFRVEESPRDNRIVVLVQSQIAPDWTYLNDERDARGHAYLLQPAECKPFELKLAAGQTLAFHLRANPTKRLGNHARDVNGKRVGIYDEQEQLEWLQRKADAGGFHIVRALLSHGDRIENAAAIPRGEHRHDLKMLSVQFDGVLRVTDAQKLTETIARGVGSGKGFGFGLLSLAPA